MALSTHVTNRIPTQTLVELTRRKNTDATTVDATLLGYACDDVAAAFAIYAGVVYDDTDSKHILTAVDGVVARLKTWARETGDAGHTEWDRWITALGALAKVTGRNRIAWTTSSHLTPSDEVLGGETVRPRFDDDAFDGLRPNMP